MSILRHKRFALADGGVLRDSGGGGGPSSTKTETSNIPDYARPYVENMLGATQKQLFNTSAPTTNPETGEVTPGQITSFKPYQAYSSNVNDYFAGPSPMMQQSYQGMANMRVAPQIGEGSVMANQSGSGLMGTVNPAGVYGGLGAAYGMGAGQNYENQATNASDVSRYMSPYMQNVVDYQKGQALRDFQMGQPMMAAKAVGQGAFGGNRLALQQSEAQRGLMSQLQGIEATGSQKAFDNAQQAQQYRANLGLQGAMQGAGLGLQGVNAQQAGYTGALNAANTLGNLGQNQYGQQMGILEGQNRFGLQQQQMEQAKINQGISDYATAQQYPYMQLGMMSNMLRGLPMQSTTTQMYQNPSAFSQFGGLAATGLGAYGAAGGFKKKGGAIKVKKYDVGGAVEADLEAMEPARLAEVAKTSQSQEIREKASRILAEKMAAQRAQQSMGLASAPAPNMDGMATMAGGGIVAFAAGKSVKDPDIGGFENVKKYITGLEEMGYGKPTEEQQMIREDIAKQRENAKDTQDQNFWRSIMMGGAKTMGGTSPNAFANFSEGVQEGLGTYTKGEKDYGDMLAKLRTGEIDLAKLNSTDRQNLMHYAISGATSEAATAERARSNELIAKEKAADRALTQKQGDESKYNAAITARAKLLIGNAVAPTDQQVQDAYNTAKRQIDEESMAGRPKKGSAGAAAPTGGGKGGVDTNNPLLRG